MHLLHAREAISAYAGRLYGVAQNLQVFVQEIGSMTNVSDWFQIAQGHMPQLSYLDHVPQPLGLRYSYESLSNSRCDHTNQRERERLRKHTSISRWIGAELGETQNEARVPLTCLS